MQVLLTGDGFAVIEGLNNDAPIGCSLKFVSGFSGVLLWRRSDNIVYALILGRQGAVEVGEAVECRIKAILQARPYIRALMNSSYVIWSPSRACSWLLCVQDIAATHPRRVDCLWGKRCATAIRAAMCFYTNACRPARQNSDMVWKHPSVLLSLSSSAHACETRHYDTGSRR